jgi:hypothetical protein
VIGEAVKPTAVPFAPELVRGMLGTLELPAEERERLIEMMAILGGLAEDPNLAEDFPALPTLREAFIAACAGDDPEALEERFLDLYAHLHMHEAPYTRSERQRVDASGGYWAHAGGLSPILKAGSWISAATRSVDLGAGNGLQGLLMQRLYPHRRCVQVEISGAMVDIGRRLQRRLGIPDDRVEWRVGDVLETPLGGWDFVYLYRPVRPVGPGKCFYEKLSAALADEPGEVVIFSIADCLREFLPTAFDCFYTDGHLTCYRKPGYPMNDEGRRVTSP